MGKQKLFYQTLLNELSDWIMQSAKQDLLTMYELVDQAKAYVNAAEELSLEEMRTLERYLLRDLKSFKQELSKEMDDSLWWMQTKNNFWQLIASLSDHNKLEFFEMLEDVAHQGNYQSGELVAIGELCCNNCGHKHQITGVERIHPCINCSGEQFSRSIVGPQ
jgi:hypothetical protein